MNVNRSARGAPLLILVDLAARTRVRTQFAHQVTAAARRTAARKLSHYNKRRKAVPERDAAEIDIAEFRSLAITAPYSGDRFQLARNFNRLRREPPVKLLASYLDGDVGVQLEMAPKTCL